MKTNVTHVALVDDHIFGSLETFSLDGNVSTGRNGYIRKLRGRRRGVDSPKNDDTNLALSPYLVQPLVLFGRLASGFEVVLVVGAETLGHGTLSYPIGQYKHIDRVSRGTADLP